MKTLKLFFSLGSYFLYSSLIAAEIPIEEIVVTPQISFSNLRLQIESAEDNMFSMVNDLMEDKEFEIICRNVVRLGSHLKKRECEPAFIRRARYLDSRNKYFRTNRQLNKHFRSKRDQMENEIADLAMENPELYQAIMRTQELRTFLRTKREERFGK